MLTNAQRLANDLLIAVAAVKSQEATGCPAALSAAQCDFESGHLERCPGNNCFGIKVDSHGSGVQYILTHEYIDGSYEQMPLAFEKYDSLADCFADHARLIQSGVYAPAWQAYDASPKGSEDLDRYIAGVAHFYATDPKYCVEITAQAHSDSVRNAIAKAITADPHELDRASDDGMAHPEVIQVPIPAPHRSATADGEGLVNGGR